MSASSLRLVALGASGEARLPVLTLQRGRGGPPVVVLPGLSDGLAPVTTPQTQSLLAGAPLPATRGDVVAFSHRIPSAAATTTRQLAADAAVGLAAVLDAPAVLICHSMGAMVAQHLAVDAPELVAALVLSATTARADAGLREALARWDALLTRGDVGGFAADAVRSSFTDSERRRRLGSLAAETAPDHDPGAVARHLTLSAACGSHDALARLRDVRAPTLVIAGEDDAVIGVANARQLAAGVAGAELVVLPGLGHGFPEQEPDRFRQLVSRFLQGVIGPAG